LTAKKAIEISQYHAAFAAPLVRSEANHSAVGVEHWSERGQYHALGLATSLNIYDYFYKICQEEYKCTR